MLHDAEAGLSLGRIVAAVEALPAGRYLLAVSGGRDSMALLDAFAWRRTDAVAAATYDHGTGRAARLAALLVQLEAARRGIHVVTARATGAIAATEEAWRAARWTFLRAAARDAGATIVTAHTRDDQLETVVMRALRDPRHTSARGLAAMYAPSRVARPFLDTARAELAAWAEDRHVRCVEDPTNADRAHLRNRLRMDLLPALEEAHPGFGASMLDLSRRASRWRAEADALAASMSELVSNALVIAAPDLSSIPPEGLAVLWPALAGRLGITLDWRGTERLVAFTAQGKVGGQVPLSGGARLERTPATFVLRASGAREALYSYV